MKKLLAIALLACSASLFAQHFNDEGFENIVCKESAAHSHLFQSPPGMNLLTGNYDLKYYRFEWYIDPAQFFIRGKATVYFETLADNFNEINFDFSTVLGIDSIVYHGEKLTNFTQSGDYLLTVPLPGTLTSGSLDSLTIAYAGAPTSGGFGSFNQDYHNGAPIVWTLSEPFGSQDWWPCKNGLDDKIDSIDVIVTTPAAYRAASNGSLVQETTLGDDKAYHWKHRYPIAPYLVAIGVTNYAQYTNDVLLGNGTNMPMLNYVYPENLSNAQFGTGRLVQVLQFYDSLFVTYPFFKEKYGHAEFGWGGGMEHQTMSFVIEYTWGLLAHELAHQWFGDLVTCGSWEDIWLNEGFATYLEGLTREHFPNQVQKQWYDWKFEKINQVVEYPDGTVKVDDTTSVDRVFDGRLSYAKGAYLLHMLRWKLGDEHFFAGIRQYLNDRRFGFSRTTTFREHLEAESGQDLTGFFADWFSGAGFPSYNLVWQQNTTGPLYIQLDQTTSHPSVDFFEMPVPVLLIGDGKDSLVRLEHTQNGQLFSLDMPFKVVSVSFDPDLWLLSANNTVEQGHLVAVKDATTQNDVLVLPNPAQDFIQVFLGKNAENSPSNWVIFNALGQKTATGESVENGMSIDISSFPAGLYRLVFSDQKGAVKVSHFLKN